MHLMWVFFFTLCFLLGCFLNKKWRISILLIEVLAVGLCIVDYTVTAYRGIGLVTTDFGADSTLWIVLQKNGIPKGRKFWVCVGWFLGSALFVVLKDTILKSKKCRLIATVVITGGFGFLGMITDYPSKESLFGGNALCQVPRYDEQANWDMRDRAVMHALGSTAWGDTLTNSYNALEYNYAKGARTFETDISFTSDGVPVLRHDWGSDLGQAEAFGWSEGNVFVPTFEEFMKAPIYGKYTPMSLLDMFRFMEKHQDVYLVTDVKLSGSVSVEEQYTNIVNVAKENGLVDVLDRLVVQIYYQSMYEEVAQVYPFKNMLLTLYVIGEQPKEELREFLTEHKMSSVTMPVWMVTDEICSYLSEKNIKVYTHTINEEEQVRAHYMKGGYGIYTDIFMPTELERWSK